MNTALCPQGGNDIVYTPHKLAERIVNHFKPQGKICEPCRGGGSFTKYMPECDWFEVEEGRDFLDVFSGEWDWIVTNPPWSKFRKFLNKSMEVADNIVFLVTVNHFWTKARVRDMKEADFSIKEILLVDTPKEFPQSGFQLGAVYIKRGYKGKAKIS